MTNRVFVYGTLKQGQSNYSLIESYVSSVTEAETAGWLFDLGAYPAALEGCGTIRGQLLEFNPECMAQAFETMDRLEGVNVDNPTQGLYERVAATALANGNRVECFIYRMPEWNKNMLPSQSNLLTDGVWPNQIEESVLYVAYGSCMSPDSLSVDLSAFERIGPVSIPERRIAFSRYSLNRKGGVADLVHCSDQIAEGILYKIPISELEQLDAREGAPYAYRRVIVEVGCDGLNLPVLTYEVSNKSPEEHAPHPDYVKLIMDGADQLSLEYRDALMAHIKQLQAGKGEV